VRGTSAGLGLATQLPWFVLSCLVDAKLCLGFTTHSPQSILRMDMNWRNCKTKVARCRTLELVEAKSSWVACTLILVFEAEVELRWMRAECCRLWVWSLGDYLYQIVFRLLFTSVGTDSWGFPWIQNVFSTLNSCHWEILTQHMDLGLVVVFKLVHMAISHGMFHEMNIYFDMPRWLGRYIQWFTHGTHLYWTRSCLFADS